MVSRSWRVGLAVRSLGLLAALVALAYVLANTEMVAVVVVLAAVAVAQLVGIVRSVERTERELARLFHAVAHDDFSQGFAPRGTSASVELAAAFSEVAQRFRVARLEAEGQRRYLEALVEHIPIAVLSLAEDGTVRLLNSAARRLLDAAAPTALDGLHRYGASFQRDVAQCKSGSRALTRTELDGVHRYLVLTSTQLQLAGGTLRLVALQDIQAELDSRELAAWQDMARVLTHEIMNSLTPIASLARTAGELVAELEPAAPEAQLEQVTDLRDAVQTLARRSDSLMRFVHRYRELTQLPPPVFAPLSVAEYFHRLARLFAAEWGGRGVTLHVTPPAEALVISVDESLLDQAVINLLRNAVHAALSGPEPQVWLEAGHSDRGRPVLEISDNGPGLDAELGEKIYLPFFTTKADGSGIGLALARQVMLVHRGAITSGPRPGGGARFRLTF